MYSRGHIHTYCSSLHNNGDVNLPERKDNLHHRILLTSTLLQKFQDFNTRTKSQPQNFPNDSIIQYQTKKKSLDFENKSFNIILTMFGSIQNQTTVLGDIFSWLFDVNYILPPLKTIKYYIFNKSLICFQFCCY